jgi:hypothetical protein
MSDDTNERDPEQVQASKPAQARAPEPDVSALPQGLHRLPPLPKGEKANGNLTRKQRKAWHAAASVIALAEGHEGISTPNPVALDPRPAHPNLAAPRKAAVAPTLMATAGGVAGTALCAGEDGSGIPRDRGRPSEFTEEEADAICAWIASGASLRSYCAKHGRSMETVYRWMRQHAHFQARYSQAHEDRADTLTDEAIAIADAAAQAPSLESVAAAKLRVETRKWMAAKLRPQKWGEKQVIQHQGAVNIRIGIPQKASGDVVDVAPTRLSP